MSRWVLVFVCNAKYMTRCVHTIESCRSVGDWTDDIVVLVDSTVDITDPMVKGRFEALECQIRCVENKAPLETIRSMWKPYKGHFNRDPVCKKLVQYIKFHIFDEWFKQWDTVFYIDSGAHIYGDLNRMKRACEPKGVLYAHSNGYPSYLTNAYVRGQFDMFLDEMIAKELDAEFPLDIDSFQSTVMIFDTSLITPSMVDELFELTHRFPLANRNDQGILNLYFHCARSLWKQIPLQDEEGLLYDFHQRDGRAKVEYLMLKYPLEQLQFR